MLANRAAVLLGAVACLYFVQRRFARTLTADEDGRSSAVVTLGLSSAPERLSGEGVEVDSADARHEQTPGEAVALPEVKMAAGGWRESSGKLRAALGVEFRLLRAERGLVVLLPLAAFASLLELAFYEVAPDPTYAAAYAAGTANKSLLFLLGLVVFYTGEGTHRDRELRVEPVVWATPVPDQVLLLSKFCAPLLLALALAALVAAAALVVQVLRGHEPLEVSAYLLVYGVILVPTALFAAAASVAVNVLLGDKHLAYAASIAAGGALFYLYTQGHNHPLYNPTLHGLWTYAALSRDPAPLLLQRAYCLALACLCLSLAWLCFRRKSAAGFAGWPLAAACASTAAAVVTGWLIR